MEQKRTLIDILEEISKQDSRYEVEAYNFVLLGFNYTMSKMDDQRHIGGKELLQGLRNYALEQYGPMARTVLEHWGITRAQDFGDIVFNLVDHGLLGKSETDSREDFKDGLDFTTAFDEPFRSS